LRESGLESKRFSFLWYLNFRYQRKENRGYLFLGHGRADPQSKTLFAQERVPSVSGSERDDVVCGRTVGNQDLFRIARPYNVFLAGSQGPSNGVEATDKLALKNPRP